MKTECERHGMANGCTVDCPALIDGDCEHQEGENKELYADAVASHLSYEE